ncbi:MAG: Cobalt-precorrin-5B C(1)-methyltransferase [Chroococcidiopsis sp. SAG 2025]|uniref:cobalt-precorrin-5B (C(1))-methyltransferase CbiD n=1 Tax=Chroococcidiopsis sp. SAG 2025 TaxID=171389 RepID=UPI0029373E48|nr:cobalt-precorrin-5B (C(1))-methyltransferase CbiD [Chroococcidiopsis sp. SAG 2025]MDV2995796.1 Cobalt-precorrin-5B C(1)-methyltransferase [Chroococcidiopsis sp. SAG 2025]
MSPRSGYTLPVFACAAAVAALQQIKHGRTLDRVSIDLLEPPEIVEIAIEQVAELKPGSALAITRSDPGDNLDITRNTPIWALVESGVEIAGAGLAKDSQPKQDILVQNPPVPEPEVGTDSPAITPNPPISKIIGTQDDAPKITIVGGEGIGKIVDSACIPNSDFQIPNSPTKPAIYAYAQRLLYANLERSLAPGETIQVTIILPEGRKLAERTSNAAFGVVDGLSLLGTTGISQPLSAPGQLDICREQLQTKARQFESLVFCVGENGLDLAPQLGIDRERLVKTANWLGSLLVEAGLQGVKEILLFGYHGKLLKLAGGIFHTHHHLADGRREILTAHCANLGLPTPVLQAIFACPTAEAALKYLRELDVRENSDWVSRVYETIALEIDRRSQEYIYNHSDRQVSVGTVLFDRDRQILVKSETATTILDHLC